MQSDAELTSVCFVNADLGWAVGDRGAIWHTLDGGRTWQIQRSPATCRLETVQFLDAENGWAVGGWTHPYTHHSTGIVLRTRDGGKIWQVIPDLTLPALKVARFFDYKRGWAAGDGSSLYPGGVFRTEDGGRTWIPIAKGRTLGWTAADFRNGDRYERGGVVAGRGGEVAIASMVELKPARTNNLGTRYLRRLVLAGESGGWLVGDGALALTTKDGGFTWSTPPSALPEAARDFDFRAVAVFGNHCWIAGNPGSCIFHSHDGGQTWQTYRTGAEPAASVAHVPGRKPRLGRWLARHHPGHARRRPHLARAAERRHSGGHARHFQRARPRSAGSFRPTVGERILSRRGRNHQPLRRRRHQPRRRRFPSGRTRHCSPLAARRETRLGGSRSGRRKSPARHRLF